MSRIRETNRRLIYMVPDQSETPDDSSTGVKEKILDSAKKLFRKSGYSAVSINDIVKAAGVTKPTVYYYFGDKQNLFTEVLAEMMRHGSDYIKEGLQGTRSLREKLYRLTEGFMEFSPTSMTAMMHDAMEQLDEAHLQRVKDAHKFFMVSTFEVLFREAQQKGEIGTRLNPLELALLYIGLLDAYTLNLSAYTGRRFDYKTQSRRVIDTLLDGIAERQLKAVE